MKKYIKVKSVLALVCCATLLTSFVIINADKNVEENLDSAGLAQSTATSKTFRLWNNEQWTWKDKRAFTLQNVDLIIRDGGSYSVYGEVVGSQVDCDNSLVFNLGITDQYGYTRITDKKFSVHCGPKSRIQLISGKINFSGKAIYIKSPAVKISGSRTAVCQ